MLWVVVSTFVLTTCGSGGSSNASGEAAVQAVDFAFDGRNITVKAGTIVNWTNTGAAPHTVTSDDGVFDSGNLDPDQVFTFTFDDTGTFPYFCRYHGAIGGGGMSGKITVTN